MSLSTQIIYLVITIVFSTVGVLGIFRYFYAVKHWINTTGTIIQFNKNYSSNLSSATYTAVVAYTTIDGEKIASQADFGTSKKLYEIGQEISIYYDPDKKQDFVIKGKAELMLSSIFLAIGIVLITLYLLTAGRGLKL